MRECDVDIQVEDLPNCFGDRFQIQCLFSNLIDNAVKYLVPQTKGLIRVTGRVDGDSIIYCVQDNGVGIEPGQQHMIGKAFYRIASTAKEGDGLGLTIVDTLLAHHKGGLEIESELGKGSCFCVYLPKAQVLQ